MKTVTWPTTVALLSILWTTSAFADFAACPAAIMADPARARAVEFLRSVSGAYTLGRCSVELHVCAADGAPAPDTDRPDSIVGDLYVTDRYGQSFYLPFDLSPVNTAKTTKIVLNGRRMVHYESIERLADPVNGRTEAYRLEIVKSDDLTRVESLDLGVFTSTLKRRYPGLPEKKSYWVNCAVE